MFKKTLAMLTAALFCAALLLIPSGGGRRALTASASPAEDPYSALRLHVMANSDSETDQAAKLAVRDAVLACVSGRLSRAESAEEAKTALMELGAELEAAARETLAERGLDYGVQLVCGRFDFPDRVYENTLYPAGEYSALRVILGEGRGRNWWCVMFPPLCVIDEAEAPAEYNGDGTLKLKSFFAELIERLFG